MMTTQTSLSLPEHNPARVLTCTAYVIPRPCHTVAMVTGYISLDFTFHLSFNFSTREKVLISFYKILSKFPVDGKPFLMYKGGGPGLPPITCLPLKLPTRTAWCFWTKDLRSSQQLIMFSPLSSTVRLRAPQPPSALLLQSPSPAPTGPRAPHLSLPPQPGWHTHASSQNGHLACGERGRRC